MASKAVRKYLAGHAEPEIELAAAVDGTWDHVIAVPALGEDASLFEGIVPAARGVEGRVLLILVVNETAAAAPEVREANRALLSAVAERFGPLRPLQPPQTPQTPQTVQPPETIQPPRGRGSVGSGEPFDVLLVDRTGDAALAEREGVGRVRKIGCDVALALAQQGKIRSEWIHTSDGDATQPPDRFRLEGEIRDEGAPAALVLPFVHEPSGDAAIDDAVTLYEISLRYWVQGLAWARSPYAFHTIGSTIAVRGEDYARVRGFPNREAGEDFYLLNKLAKVGRVEAAGSCGPVHLRNRRSRRVPFGTGAATIRITEAAANGEPFCMYDPETFALLRRWLEGLEAFAASGHDPLAVATAGLPAAEAGALRDAIETLDAMPALASIRDRHAGGDVRSPVHTWFDAFRTMRLVHLLRDPSPSLSSTPGPPRRGRRFPDLPWRDALAAAPFLLLDAGRDAPSVLARLRALEASAPV